ncbi:MAG TPA: translation initiation factor IF-2 [Thiomicrospira sp.]|jgi:translation initiation factor IF-2|nr:translation initiation factor IF-2 [Thiomicrospira sp.]
MANKTIREAMREFNVGLDTVVDFLKTKDIEIKRATPRAKISEEAYTLLQQEFQSDKSIKDKSATIKKAQDEAKAELRKEHDEVAAKEATAKKEAEEISGRVKIKGPKIVGKVETLAEEPKKEKASSTKAEPKAEEKVSPKTTSIETPKVEVKSEETKVAEKKPVEQKPPVKETIPVSKDVDSKKETPEPPKSTKKIPKAQPTVPKEEKKEAVKPESEEKKKEEEKSNEIETKYQKLKGIKTTGEKIDLGQFDKKPKKKAATSKTEEDKTKKKRKRKRISADKTSNRSNANKGKRSNYKKPVEKKEATEEEIQKQIKETLERLQGRGKSKRSKIKREGRQKRKEQALEDQLQQDQESKVLKVTEFITVADLANMMDVPVTSVITACFNLGVMVTMNQRLDAETLSLVADEFNYDVKFVDAEEEIEDVEVEDAEEDLVKRPPIVTIMGHVDHGKTSLLDYIRNENVVAGESGGITQHIGAYKVELENGEKLTFIDTPGHEAFTAMRARGTKVTDVAVIVIAADDNIMPQTKEAISHAQAAGVPMIFAINKIDRPTANPDNIKQQLATMNLLVEDWGGKYQSQEISAKTGQGVDELLEKIILEAEMLDLKANPNRHAVGTVLEAALDKGRGYVADILVQNGTLRIGDYVLAGKYHGKVKAMYDERDRRVKAAEPSTPVRVLGLDGAPTAGDRFKVYEDEREAKKIAQKRDQIIREQQLRAQKHITLDEIGRRIALGDFKELNLIIKGDVDGSVEALSDSLQKLSTENVSVNIIHKAVGQITDTDVNLAAASDAIIIGFNVRPSASARQLAEQEQVQIKTYSIIYDVINDVKEAMEGMLSPEIKEEITGTAEVRETFKVSKVGTIAGCMVTTGKIYNHSKVRVIREGIVIHDGDLASLKRFKDDVKEVSKGYECGIMIKNYNNIEIGDMIEAYQNFEVKRKL